MAEFAAYCTFLKQRHDQLAHARILLICGAARNDKSCPGETSKTYRMAKLAQTIFENHRAEVDVLDLSLLTSEYGRVIYPVYWYQAPSVLELISSPHRAEQHSALFLLPFLIVSGVEKSLSPGYTVCITS